MTLSMLEKLSNREVSKNDKQIQSRATSQSLRPAGKLHPGFHSHWLELGSLIVFNVILAAAPIYRLPTRVNRAVSDDGLS